MMRFLKDQRGAVSLEYGLIVALLVVGIIGIISQIGAKVANYFGLVIPAFL